MLTINRHPDWRTHHKFKPKVLGDNAHMLLTQDVGTFSTDGTGETTDAFVKLAHSYIFDVTNKRAACELNAEVFPLLLYSVSTQSFQVAFEVRKYYAGQIWLLLAAALAVVVPEESIEPHIDTIPSAIPHATVISPHLPEKKPSPGRTSNDQSPKPPSRNSSLSTPKKITPTSSASSSPLQVNSSLPPLTPNQSYLGRRASVDSNVSRRPSVYRRKSLSIHNSSPSDRNVANLRHVGEGALDDSDTSSDEEADMEESSDDDTNPKSSFPTATVSSSRLAPTHPSPLSRLASRNSWTEDEDGQQEEDTSSPSPQSTDSGSEQGSRQRPKTSRRGSVKSRSRSSTIASLTATQYRPVIHQTSVSSIQTVLATEATDLRELDGVGEIKAEETLRNIAPTAHGHQRQKSHPIPEFFPDDHKAESAVTRNETRPEVVREERNLHDVIWSVLREALETFANEVSFSNALLLFLISVRATFKCALCWLL